MNHSVVGRNCVIGAHTLIPEGKMIPDGSLVIGSPGRVVRELNEEEVEEVKRGAGHYVKNAEWFREGLLEVGDDEVEAPISKL